jgi:ornithine cyclodeaminase/alanine dehydrogenase-like protein (mu-crystallin family)
VLLLNNRDVEAVLTSAMAIAALKRAYLDLAAGEAVCRPRIDIRIPTRDPDKCYQWGTMEGGSTEGYFAIRVKSDVLYQRQCDGERTQEKYCGRPGRYCGLILLLEVETGLPLALLNDGFLQHVRVAADGAIGAELMARRDSRVLGMLGSGGMARAHVEALVAVRKIERLQVFSPTRDHRERFASEMRERHGLEVIAADEPGTACRGADILAACTDSATPVLRGEWLEPGMHVISIGGRPHRSARELFDRVLRLGTAPAPIGRPELGTADEYLGYLARPSDPRWRAMRGGRAAPQVTGFADDLVYADVVDGRVEGRRSDRDITYAERGNIQGAQFYAVAAVVYREACQRGLGKELPTDWLLQDIRN